MRIRSTKTPINILFAMVMLIILAFLKVVISFYSSRLAVVNDRTKTNIKEKGYRKLYSDFYFISDDNKNDSFYSNH